MFRMLKETLYTASQLWAFHLSAIQAQRIQGYGAPPSTSQVLGFLFLIFSWLLSGRAEGPPLYAMDNEESSKCWIGQSFKCGAMTGFRNLAGAPLCFSDRRGCFLRLHGFFPFPGYQKNLFWIPLKAAPLLPPPSLVQGLGPPLVSRWIEALRSLSRIKPQKKKFAHYLCWAPIHQHTDKPRAALGGLFSVWSLIPQV